MYAVERYTDLLVFEVCHSWSLIDSLDLRVNCFRVVALTADFEIDVWRDLDFYMVDGHQQFLLNIKNACLHSLVIARCLHAHTLTAQLFLNLKSWVMSIILQLDVGDGHCRWWNPLLIDSTLRVCTIHDWIAHDLAWFVRCESLWGSSIWLLFVKMRSRCSWISSRVRVDAFTNGKLFARHRLSHIIGIWVFTLQVKAISLGEPRLVHALWMIPVCMGSTHAL